MHERLQRDIQTALRAHQAERLSVLRMLAAGLQSKQIEKRSKTGNLTNALTDDDMIAVLKHEAKKRADAIQQFSAAGRADLSEKEKWELSVIQEYLPPELPDNELEALLGRVIVGFGIVTEKDRGKLMGAVMKEVGGRASGERVKTLIDARMRGSQQ